MYTECLTIYTSPSPFFHPEIVANSEYVPKELNLIVSQLFESRRSRTLNWERSFPESEDAVVWEVQPLQPPQTSKGPVGHLLDVVTLQNRFWFYFNISGNKTTRRKEKWTKTFPVFFINRFIIGSIHKFCKLFFFRFRFALHSFYKSTYLYEHVYVLPYMAVNSRQSNEATYIFQPFNLSFWAVHYNNDWTLN